MILKEGVERLALVKTSKGYEVRFYGWTVKTFSMKEAAKIYMSDSVKEDGYELLRKIPVMDKRSGKLYTSVCEASKGSGITPSKILQSCTRSRRDARWAIVDRDDHIKAERKAEERMEQLKKQAKPKFEDVMTKMYAMAAIGKAKGENQGAADIVLSMAEKQLYREIKDGCVWPEEDQA